MQQTSSASLFMSSPFVVGGSAASRPSVTGPVMAGFSPVTLGMVAVAAVLAFKVMK